jgi:D-beta-D-heptose 7-phosphate kinase/D-beta-D-heptose 1-phosphate adenosyltransferase
LLEETGAQFVHATLDEDGVVVLERNRKPYVISGCPHKNEQAIGAGDTYVAALTLGLAVGMSGQVAGEIAHAAAGFVLDRAGTATCSLDQLCLYFSENPKEVHDRDLLAQLIRVLKSTGKRIVFTNGCFDILHRGHVSYLQQAAALGDLLIVGVNTDESIRRLKGSERPINTLDDRMAVLAALNCVTYIVPFHEETPIDLIRIIQPDIYVKGADYTLERLPEARVVQELGGRVELIPFVHDRSTTQIIKKIKEFDSDSLASFAQLG